MFINEELSTMMDSDSTINSQSQIIAEWNLNSFENIKKIGNYRYRPTVASPTTSNYGVIAPTYDSLDTLGAYTGATDSDIVVDGGYNESQVPEIFLSKDKKKQMLYSLEDCFFKNRPRSGINKVLYFEGKKINTFSKDMFQRPRYYVSAADDKFKYWTSYRKEVASLQAKFFVSNIKLSTTTTGAVEYFTARYTTSADHGLKVGDEVIVKDSSSKLFKFLPKTYTVKTVPTTTTFTVSETSAVYNEVSELVNNSQISADIIGNSGLAVAVTGNEVTDVTVFINSQTTEYGISAQATVGDVTANYISDAAPFIVYENALPTNRIIIKTQTNVGKVSSGQFTDGVSTYDDPFYGDSKKTVPDSWKVQYLDSENNWTDLAGEDGALALDETDIGADGYLELSYGLIVPEEYRDIFIYAGSFSTEAALPDLAPEGYAYLVKSGTAKGMFHIYDGADWASFEPVYAWANAGEEATRLTNYVTDMVAPESFIEDSQTIYRELQNIYGLRVVATSMNVASCTFDLIELSPRLVVDLTDKVISVQINKGSSDIGNSGILVNGLVVSNGTVEIFDYDNSFGEYNADSVLAIKDSEGTIKYNVASKNMQVKVYDIIYTETGMGYHIPVKVMYSDGFPSSESRDRRVSINLRDTFSFFEAMTATEVLFSNASLSFIIASLMDSIGFTNYIFKRIEDKDEPIIPYFFVRPNLTVAQVLEELAISTQTAVFFDEYNNLVFMSKEYMMPDLGDRSVDYTFRGSKDSQVSSDGIVKNERLGSTVASVIDIASKDEEIYNDGKIVYATRNVLKNYSSLLQAELRDSEKSWKYQNVLLWEIAPEQTLKPINDEDGNAAGYTLSAIPLNSQLTEQIPTVSLAVVTAAVLDSDTREITYTSANSFVAGDIVTVTSFTDNKFNVENARIKSATSSQFIVDSRYKKSMTADLTGDIQDGKTSHAIHINDNIVDFGESVQWASRYKGYLYANAEIIKYDAIEYSVSGLGLVWISSPTEYKNYFAKMSFGGNIYATGRVRIYTEPKYDNGVIKAGEVSKHGRGQFNTTTVNHQATMSSYWTTAANKGACKMTSSYLFNLSTSIPVTSKTGQAGMVESKYHPATTSIIKNVLSRKDISEKELFENKVIDGTVQASALVMTGPSENTIDHISYVHKPLEGRYNHFGTRMRIIGKPAEETDGSQTPVGTLTYLTTNNTKTNAQVSVAGSSAGIAVMNDKTTNIGYYMEMVALTDASLASYSNVSQKIYNVFFYKIERGIYDPTDGVPTGTDALPIPLWAGQTSINVDDGNFAGQFKKSTEDLPTVYDIAVEYTQQPDGSLMFYLFLNNKVIANVVDSSPIPNRPNSMSLFVRGKTKAMFENIYALSLKNTSDTNQVLDAPIQSVFNYDKERGTDALFKYGISGVVKDTYLSGITASGDTKYNLYFDEFGTIFREVVYMDVKYDKAYPALYAKMMPTFSAYQNYVISGFQANPYSAKFLIFNATDSVLDLNLEKGSSYLRIGGVSFTSQSDNNLSVDDYFAKYANMAEQEIDATGGISAVKSTADYASIKNSRLVYGKKEFTLNATYIQSRDAADEMMSWMISKMMRPRKLIGIKAFSNPMLQLGDIVTIDYEDANGNDVVAQASERFVIYNIDYKRSADGPEMSVYLSEVV
jgi:hypothetical protein